ncbi:M28 family peptidase [candidate division KSB1 bacterium]
MRTRTIHRLNMIIITVLLISTSNVYSQALKTPLNQNTLDILTNEISGQMIYNNEVLLAGAPWVRDREEFTGTFYESQKIYEIAKKYGIETVSLERHPRSSTFDYPVVGEFWLLEPEKRLIARLGADAALVARGSQTADFAGELIYIPPLSPEKIEQMITAGIQPEYNGKIALMWSHARGNTARALDAAGLKGVVSFSSRDRYLDPNQVVYGSGTYSGENLKAGLSVSWRQWSELFEDIETGKKPVVRCKTEVETYQDKFETVYAWIPGTEPDKKGIVFSAHLFEGYLKRGANDNMSGCVIQLEILRALTKLIKDGVLPQPRRTIYFVWPNEISGTYEFISRNTGLPGKWSANINMDMCGESLRKNNGLMTMSECPNHLPSYLDGLTESILNYVWRTNDIVYLPDSPRGRQGGQYFPKPMMEKNGTTDAFRYFIHTATGGSDHICFNNSSVAVPGIELFTWPDQWYHADTDTPDKSDPTQMKRIAFIGAASAWAAANCTDSVLKGLIDVTSEFGYSRIAEREHPKALGYIENASAEDIQFQTNRAFNLIDLAFKREIGALKSIEEVYTGSEHAQRLLGNRISQWEFHRESLQKQLIEYAGIIAKQQDIKAPRAPKMTSLEKRYNKVFPAIHPEVYAKQFSLNGSERYQVYLNENPDVFRELGIGRAHSRSILNFINGKNSITEIRNHVSAETGEEIQLENVARYIEILKEMQWVDY